MDALRRTALYDTHRRLGARFVEFAGWEMPLEYSSILEEHRAVRERAGLFDVSHMGQIQVAGLQALEFVQKAVTNDVAGLPVGRALYALMCRSDGGILDDLIIYRTGARRFLLVVNAANRRKDFTWLSRLADGFAETRVDSLEDRCLIALQGPRSAEILEAATGLQAGDIPFFGLRQGVAVAGAECMVARTGYTGEDGFEIMCPVSACEAVWDRLLSAGQRHGLVPAGLGARDTLRLEAGLPLYGNELSEETNPFEAGLDRFVKLEKGDFVGREALLAIRERGVQRAISGLVMRDRAIPRRHYPVFLDGKEVGTVTSGGFSPMLKQGIAMALLDREAAAPGNRLQIQVRGRLAECEAVGLPFYRSFRKRVPEGAGKK